jgi:carboxyl-terminal processing protease
LNDAVSKIRGAAGTVSTLKLQRADKEPFVVRIQRGNINVASVTWKDEGNGTLYIRISQFGADTNKEWAKAVSEANVQMKELDAVIVDVRSNPGGYLDSAFYIGDEFVKKGPILWQEDPTGKQTPMDAERTGAFENIPSVYVLIDEGSASASEILAAALRDDVGAKLIGMQSFGKGTIQDAKDFKDGSGIHLTIAKWLTPKKDWVHKKGLEPDVVVQPTEDDIKNSKDVQLEKALELAKQI